MHLPRRFRRRANLPNQIDVFPDSDHFGGFSTTRHDVRARHPQVAVVMGVPAGGAYPADVRRIDHREGAGDDLPRRSAASLKAATGGIVTAEELSGADVHARAAGVAKTISRWTTMLATRQFVGDLNRPKRVAMELRTRSARFPADDLYGVSAPTSASPTTCASDRASSTAASSTNSRRVTGRRSSRLRRLWGYQVGIVTSATGCCFRSRR